MVKLTNGWRAQAVVITQVPAELEHRGKRCDGESGAGSSCSTQDLKTCTQHNGGAGSCDRVWKVGITTNLKPTLNYQHFFKLLKPCQSWSTCRKILMVTIDSLGWLQTVEWEIYNRPWNLKPEYNRQSLSAAFLQLPYLLSKQSLHSRRVGWWWWWC